METKQQKSKEYANWLHKNLEEQLGYKCVPHDEYYRRGDILQAFEVGWDEALKSILVDALKELPEYDIDVWVINEKGERFYCHRSKNKRVKAYKDEWCNYTGSDIIAWIRPISFDEILKLNKDVLKRLKGE